MGSISGAENSKAGTSWDMSQFQNFHRISLETSVFYVHFQGYALNNQTGHGRGRLGYEVNFLSNASGSID